MTHPNPTQPSAPQPPPYGRVDAASPAPPARQKGFVAALTAAIVVSALPIIALPVFLVWSFAATFDQLSSVAAEGAEYPGDVLAAEIPADLTWDVQVGGEVYTWLIDSFPSDGDWEAISEAGPSTGEYEHVDNGCYVWFTNLALEPGEISDGDRAASIGIIETALARDVADEEAFDTEITAVGDGSQKGSADAVAVDYSTGQWHGVAIARAFTGIGEGVVYLIECTVEADLEQARSRTDDLITLELAAY